MINNRLINGRYEHTPPAIRQEGPGNDTYSGAVQFYKPQSIHFVPFHIISAGIWAQNNMLDEVATLH